MQLQRVRIVDDIMNRREALDFQDFLRRPMTRPNMWREATSLGHPGIYDRLRPRTIDWMPVGFQAGRVEAFDLGHVWDGDVYVSPHPDRVGTDYRGQTFACFPDGPADYVDLPPTVGGFYIFTDIAEIP
jgi:hypothetical protein